ncbi:MAG: FAD-binding oxidoreductase [Sphingomonadales bacterium]|nr:FAD-binding oxidoreductase [Sphingomonadales bacterium]MDE2170791.1 FAD-binding oxidoreductase [Sphingomonadales bacterium]
MTDASKTHYDIIVIGAGIAGISLASYLAADHTVLVVEAEGQPGYHSTGRSAALFSESYGPVAVRALSRASGAFFRQPPKGFSDTALTTPRGFLAVADAEHWQDLQAFGALPEVRAVMRPLSTSEVLVRCPVLRPNRIAGGMIEAGAADIDVHALLQGYLRRLRAAGGRLASGLRVEHIERTASGWIVRSAGQAHSCRVIINAAGAWADDIAAKAGLTPIGLQPKRRTAALVDTPPSISAANWPLVYDCAEHFYFKPDAGNILISPGDETPSEPTDAQPEELDVAIAVDRIMTATTIPISRIRSRWAGLRSFVSDGEPVAGYDPGDDGFFWLAGQGGYGIQTAPALARLAAAMVDHQPVPEDIASFGLVAGQVAPGRLHEPGA